jgi:hypothetical protein
MRAMRRCLPVSVIALATAGFLAAASARADFIVYEVAGANGAAITPTRDAFRTAVGGGTVAGANGSFGGLRREINWDGVPDTFSDPNPLPANFFNANSARGAVFSTPGTGFLVSANAGGISPTLFGFPGDFQTFSPQKLFTAVNSNITDVNFFVPGTSVAATTSAFGVIFVGVEAAGLTRVDLFDEQNHLIFTRNALVGGHQGLSFLGGVADAGERIGRVRITSGLNTIVSNGVLGSPSDDAVVMDDFLYSEPLAVTSVPAPPAVVLVGLGAGCVALRRLVRRRPTA